MYTYIYTHTYVYMYIHLTTCMYTYTLKLVTLVAPDDLFFLRMLDSSCFNKPYQVNISF